MKHLMQLLVCILLSVSLVACGTPSASMADGGAADSSEAESAASADDRDMEADETDDSSAEDGVSGDEALEDGDGTDGDASGDLPAYTPVDFDGMPENAEEDFLYTVVDGVAEISGYIGTATQVKIPATLGGAPVCILTVAFAGNEKITAVCLPEDASFDNVGTFADCTALEEIVIPGSSYNVEFPDGAFSNCTALRRVEIGEGWKIISNSCFSGCENLTDLVLPSTITDIGSTAFSGCAHLESVDLSGTALLNISAGAFQGCQRLESVSLPSTLCWWGASIFVLCPSLTEITFPNGNDTFEVEDGILYTTDGKLLCKLLGYEATDVTIREGTLSLRTHAFDGDAYMTSVTIPDSVTEISASAFAGCTSLTSVTFGGSLEAIDEYAFLYCPSLTELSLPDTLSRIGVGAFQLCASLTSVSLPDGILLGDGEALEDIFEGCENAVFTYKGQTYAYDDLETLTGVLGG